jgi:hypothetical protein
VAALASDSISKTAEIKTGFTGYLRKNISNSLANQFCDAVLLAVPFWASRNRPPIAGNVSSSFLLSALSFFSLQANVEMVID